MPPWHSPAIPFETPGTYIELYESTYAAQEAKNPLISDMGIAYRVKGILTFNKDLAITRGVELYSDQDGGIRGMGIHLPGASHIQFFDNFEDNIIENNIAAAIRIRMDDVNKIVYDNSIHSGSPDVPAVEIHMGLDDSLGTWKNLDAEIDYRILEPLKIKATKDPAVEAGTTIQLLAGRTIEVSGGLLVNGQSGAPVTFEGTVSKKGYWDGIFLNGTQRMLINHAMIHDA
jgi:hypothetical protein